MKKLNLLFLISLITIIISCKKEDIVPDSASQAINNKSTSLVEKIFTDNQPTYLFTYNDSGMISEVKSRYSYVLNNYNGAGNMVSTEYYGNDDVLSTDLKVSQSALNSNVWITPSNGKKGGALAYVYDNNSRLVKTVYSCQGQSQTGLEYSEYVYNGSNRISRQTMYWDKVATGYIDYSYDSKGNLVKEALYNTQPQLPPVLATTTEYEFDSGLNPFRRLEGSMIPGLYTNTNNIVKVTYTMKSVDGKSADKVQVTQSNYEYNSLGYPTSKNGNIMYVYKQ